MPQPMTLFDLFLAVWPTILALDLARYLIAAGLLTGVLSAFAAPLAGRRFDIILSNPPYIADGDPCFEGEGIGREPGAALRSGPSGLDALRAICGPATRHLAAGGWILLEHGCNQQHDVAHILRQGGLSNIACHTDYAGHPRITAAPKQTEAETNRIQFRFFISRILRVKSRKFPCRC